MTGRHDPLDRYSSQGATLLHRADARVTLLAAAALVLLFSFTPPSVWPAPAGVSVSLVHVFGAIALALLMVWAGIPLAYAFTRLAVFVPLLAAVAVSVPLARGFDAAGWSYMGQALIRGTLAFATLLVLANVTPSQRLLAAMRQLGVPALLVATLGFMVRYQALLLDELQRMRRARLSRSFDHRGTARWRTAASLVGPVVLRSLDRAQRVHAAMLARGFDGTIRSLDR